MTIPFDNPLYVTESEPVVMAGLGGTVYVQVTEDQWLAFRTSQHLAAFTEHIDRALAPGRPSVSINASPSEVSAAVREAEWDSRDGGL